MVHAGPGGRQRGEIFFPVSWGYRKPFGIRFAPRQHPPRGAGTATGL